jgi:hypothetical protein
VAFLQSLRVSPGTISGHFEIQCRNDGGT